MDIVIDIRGLTSPHQSGVGMYTTYLLRALFTIDTKNHYVLFSSGSKKVKPFIPSFHYQNVEFSHLSVPNRLLKASILFTKKPHVPHIKTPGSLVFLPSVNITSFPSSTPYILTIHDLSFELFPKLYSHKRRLWHRLARPQELAKNARAIIVPSESTKHDVERIYKIDSKKIRVIPHGISDDFCEAANDTDEAVKKIYVLPERFLL